MAAVLAEAGYTSSEMAVEASRGWANVVGVTKEAVPGSLERWSGMKEDNEVGLVRSEGSMGRWEIVRNSFKPYPCGIVIHPVIDGCSQLHEEMKKQGLKSEDIKSVEVVVHPLVLELTGRRKPQDELQAKFSVYHGGAIGLIWGKGTPSQYEDEGVRSAEVIDVRDKIDAKADKSLRPDETHIALTMTDGRILQKHVEHAVGSLEVPLTNDMLREKFIDQTKSILGDRTEAASRILWDIEQVQDMRDLARSL